MNKIKTRCPAKINLYLKVLNKRVDGYHNLETSFQLIDLADDISFEVCDKDISIASNKDFLCNTENTVFKSAQKIKSLFKVNDGVKIHINKRIPIGAGLGGGSSNAASTIVALNSLWKLNLGIAELINIGKEIGADVPFFICGKNSLAKGIGEKLKDTDSIKDNILLIKPNIHNSTKKMFDEIDLHRESDNFKTSSSQNDFWDIFLRKNNTVKKFYNENNKEYDLNLTGTGSCIYVTYDEKKELNKILKKIPSNWRLFFCKPLQYSPICYIR